jgi:hypothetical protein
MLCCKQKHVMISATIVSVTGASRARYKNFYAIIGLIVAVGCHEVGAIDDQLVRTRYAAGPAQVREMR